MIGIRLPKPNASVMTEQFETVRTETPDDGDDDPEPPGRLQLDIIIEDGDWSAFAPVEDALNEVAEVVARHLNLDYAEAAIALSSDERVRSLNRTYRGMDKPTNVLSFPAAEAGQLPGEPRHLGDIILAAETVRREAAAEGKPPRHHLQHLVVHGLLHLLGYEHESETQARVMEALEVEILRQIGVPDPYAAPFPSEA